MRTSARKHHYFDARSVLLFAALSLGGGAAIHAHAADGQPGASLPGPSQRIPPAPVQLTPPAATNPANSPPASAQPNTPPSLPMSPAFGPNRAAAGTGDATHPDKRPEITATMPTGVRTAFDRADANKDDQLSAKEVQKLPAMSARFHQLDTNHDGMLSRQEFDAGARL